MLADFVPLLGGTHAEHPVLKAVFVGVPSAGLVSLFDAFHFFISLRLSDCIVAQPG